jgi:FtsZ-interacting cell division protein ZipA
MSTIAIVLIVIGAVIVIALLATALSTARRRRLEDRRQIAGEHREEATSRRLQAEKEARLPTSRAPGQAFPG